MTRIIPALDAVAADYEVLYCDLWGCLHDGRAAFPDAVAALAGFRARGGTVLLLTNSPRPAPAVVRQLDRLGVPREAYDLVTSSGDAAQAGMLAGVVGHRVWHLGPPRDASFFTDMAPDLEGADRIERVGFEAAEGIVCTGLFDDLVETPDDYAGRLIAARERRLRLLCANPDIAVDFGGRRIWCAGALAQAYERIGGTALYFGKPHPPIYDLAARRLAARLGRVVPKDRILAIGDGIATDIRGAAGEGIDALFVTGGLAADRFGPDRDPPDPGRLAAFLAAEQAAPRFAIGRLR